MAGPTERKIFIFMSIYLLYYIYLTLLKNMFDWWPLQNYYGTYIFSTNIPTEENEVTPRTF